MNLHTLRSAPGARRRGKRVGCGEGSGHGKTCGRGTKGQMSRKGHKGKLGFEGGQMRLIRRIPKRGFNNPAARRYAVVNVGDLRRLAEGAEVTLESLRGAGIVRGLRWDGVRILGGGGLDRKLSVKVSAVSAAARAKIEAAGGTCESTGEA